MGNYSYHHTSMSSTKAATAWTWDSLPSFQDISTALTSQKEMYAKLVENSDMFKEVEKALKDLQSRVAKLQLNAEMDTTVQSIKANVDKLMDLLKTAMEKRKGKSAREIFAQPQVKSALTMFGDRLDWINKLLDDYLKENKVATKPRATIDEGNKKKT